jgi:trehalose 6-phosphate phosphatase
VSAIPEGIERRLAQAERLWLFLDYDGTLAEFAPTPEHILPDPELTDLLARLAKQPRLRVSVVSGRRLRHIQQLVPLPGILLAGTYGVELQMPGGERIDRLDFDDLRPTLDAVKPHWEALIAGRQGFFLEDKGWTLALHARFAEACEAERVLAEASRLAVKAIEHSPPELFRLLGGHKFLEIGPRLANKGQTVEYLLKQYPWPGGLPIFMGDDDKDEEAFRTVKAHEGIAVLVAARPRESEADLRLDSPQAARRWLAELAT